MGERVGIFGGTFDPPHVGHLVAAVNVRFDLELDRMLLVVANEPWQKTGEREVTPAEDRLAMVAAAVADHAGLEASDIEIRRGGPSYTADTLEELSAASPDDVLHVVLGWDAAVGLPSWERVDRVRELAEIVVVDRPGGQAQLPEGFRWTRVVIPQLDVSSTDVRDRLADGRPVDYLLPDRVVECLRERRLYRSRR